MDLSASAEIIKQLKEDIDKAEEAAVVEGKDDAPEVQAVDAAAGSAEEVPEKAQESGDEGEESGKEAEGEGVEDTGEDDALSDDAKKRAKAFGEARQEKRELKEKLEAAEKRAQEQAERLARLEGRMEATAKPEQKQEDAEPDALLYPDDHNQWKLRKMEARLAKAEATAAEAQGFATYQKETRGVALLEQAFKSSNPNEDYDGAVKFMVERERALKKVMNPGLTDAQADAQTESEKVGLFKTLFAQGRDPAKVILDMAKAQGFKPKTEGGKTDKEISNKTNLQKLADNQRRSASLIGGSPAGKGKAPLTSEDVLGMSFSKLLKLPKAERERLANGGEE